MYRFLLPVQATAGAPESGKRSALGLRAPWTPTVLDPNLALTRTPARTSKVAAWCVPMAAREVSSGAASATSLCKCASNAVISSERAC